MTRKNARLVLMPWWNLVCHEDTKTQRRTKSFVDLRVPGDFVARLFSARRYCTVSELPYTLTEKNAL